MVKGFPKKEHLPDENDTYEVFGDDNKYLYSIGVGNPFYANATHIGYEDSKVMGGLVNSINLDITLPMNIEPTKFVFQKEIRLAF